MTHKTEDFITRYDQNGNLFCLPLDGVRTYHKIIRGCDIFVYNLKARGLRNGWVCIDTKTGASIDNVVSGHKTKKDAFQGGIDELDQYSDEVILKAQQNALRQIAKLRVDSSNKQGCFNKGCI